MSDTQIEKIRISCPICSNKHMYKLEVSKSVVLYHMTPGMETSTKYVRVRRLFACANDTKKDFQAVIKLPQHFGEKIHGVKVLPN